MNQKDDDIVDNLRNMAYIIDKIQGKAVITMLSGSMLNEAADEIERLQALCNDLHYDATCNESFCRLCGEGIKELETDHG